MRRDEPPGPDGEIGPGDWNSGPWGPAEEPQRPAEDVSATIAALREQIRRAESGRTDGGRAETGRAGNARTETGRAENGRSRIGGQEIGREASGRAEAGQEAGPVGRRRQGRGRTRGDRARLQEPGARGDRPAPGDWASPGESAAPGRRAGRGDWAGSEGPGVPGDLAGRGDWAGLGEPGTPGRRGKRRRSDGWLPDGPEEGTAASAGPPADPEAVARAICLRLLTMAPKTRAQLADALRKRDVPEDAANAVLERFSEVGLIDDKAFAAAWVSSRHTGRGLARRALAQELRQRGVAEETVKDAVGQLDPDEEAETARRLVDRKLAATRGVEPQARMRRLVGMLARKGYSPGLAFRVVREAIEAEGSPSDGLPETFE
ncbi:recombination regulator RecX [Microbispora hainanensis]|uniref:Regulatory protein RecX n=1 Tax=Microbispora hainanensis TaxID=568844 RepID=A0ABZ1SSJ3_9ACTN|nr:recombination regulator RecX [Microbispora hainanensis]